MLTLLSVAFAQPASPPPAPAKPATAPVAPPAQPSAAPPAAPVPAGAPTEIAIRAELDRVYGKHVPDAAVCLERSSLEAPFRTHVTVVGVRQGQRGCVLFGVMVDNVWFDPAQALPAAVDRAAWDTLPTADRTARIVRWTDDVLLAFDHPSAEVPATVAPAGKGFTVERRLLRRADRMGGVTDLTERSTFDAGLVRTSATHQIHGESTSLLVTRPETVTGLSQAVVEQALTSRGVPIRGCFTKLWEADPTLEGRVVLSWTVTAGKVDPVAVVQTPGEVPNEALASCYAAQIRAATWPPEANGTATWVFWVERRPAGTP